MGSWWDTLVGPNMVKMRSWVKVTSRVVIYKTLNRGTLIFYTTAWVGWKAPNRTQNVRTQTGQNKTDIVRCHLMMMTITCQISMPCLEILRGNMYQGSIRLWLPLRSTPRHICIQDEKETFQAECHTN